VIKWSFSEWCRTWSKPLLLPAARFLGGIGLSPNMVTIIGLFAYAASGLVLGIGYPLAAGLILAALGPLDAVDGLLAREQGKVTVFGAFLDSTLDRYAEFFLFLGLAAYLLLYENGGFPEAVMVISALTGSIMVSYARARAEALGFDCRVGIMTRFERLLILAAGLIFGWIFPVLVFLAFFTHVTAIHRIVHVYRQAK